MFANTKIKFHSEVLKKERCHSDCQMYHQFFQVSHLISYFLLLVLQSRRDCLHFKRRNVAYAPLFILVHFLKSRSYIIVSFDVAEQNHNFISKSDSKILLHCDGLPLSTESRFLGARSKTVLSLVE